MAQNYGPEKQYHQRVKVVASKDFKFLHIDAGIGPDGMHRVETETSEESVVNCLLYPVLDEIVRKRFPELKGMALTIHIERV